MPTIRISDETAEAINELGGTFDKPDDVLQRIIRDAGYRDLLEEDDSEPEDMNSTRTTGTRQDWIDSWLANLEQQANKQGVSFRQVSGRGGADFEITGKIRGKIRVSKSWKRDHGKIWLRFDDELKWARDNSGQKTVAVVLDIYDGSASFTDQDHFFVLDQDMLLTETSDAGNRDLQVYSPGEYEDPFDRFADDWEGWY